MLLLCHLVFSQTALDISPSRLVRGSQGSICLKHWLLECDFRDEADTIAYGYIIIIQTDFFIVLHRYLECSSCQRKGRLSPHAEIIYSLVEDKEYLAMFVKTVWGFSVVSTYVTLQRSRDEIYPYFEPTTCQHNHHLHSLISPGSMATTQMKTSATWPPWSHHSPGRSPWQSDNSDSRKSNSSAKISSDLRQESWQIST